MFKSLRFRLPAFFLAGVALAGIVSTAIAVQLFQDHIRSQSLAELKREARGLTQLYQQLAIRSSDEGRSAPDFAAAELERATGARLFYVGVPIFPGPAVGASAAVPGGGRLGPVGADPGGQGRHVRLHAAGRGKTFLAVGQPLHLAGVDSPIFGALIVAKKKTELTHGWLSLVELLFVALGVGLVVAGALAWYLSRRIARPVLALSAAADRIAGGKYDIAVPEVPGSGEVSHLADRFREMASRLSGGRGAGAELPDVGLARAADAADGDPGPRRGAARRARGGPRVAGGVARR